MPLKSKRKSPTPPTRSGVGIDGVSRCARYAFGPNRLHLCGPGASREVFDYVRDGAADGGLEHLLTQFRTLYPYLQTIARANRIADPFDARVVEAYWIGNDLLDTIPPKTYFRHLTDVVELQKRSPRRTVEAITEKLRHGARMHHSFHVLNLYRRTGNDPVAHTFETFADCLVSWGTVVSVDGPVLRVRMQPLVLHGHQLALGNAVERRIVRRLWDDDLLDGVRVHDLLTMHWGMPCEVITPVQARALERVTLRHIALANQTL
ncbi:MAG: hypothetical protein HY341_02500 [Candidatus Kerfeldbacteria bacterium]|nr:hypothetical protein [Candidatus Kerfeldbacteria bacterium]